MDTLDLIGSTLGLGFLAGIRLYATVLALGLAIRFNILHPGADQESLRVLAHPLVLIAAGAACMVEFAADKIPWVDSIWDAFHTFIRPVGAALLAAAALGHADPALKVVLVILSGGMALASHSTKAATRVAINHSPEPFTNIGMSLAEDTFAPFGLWLTMSHPAVTLVLVAAFAGVFVWAAPKIVRAIRRRIAAVRAWFSGNSPVTSA